MTWELENKLKTIIYLKTYTIELLKEVNALELALEGRQSSISDLLYIGLASKKKYLKNLKSRIDEQEWITAL